MGKRVILFAIFLAVFSFISARPFPQFEENGQELLAAKDTRYYRYPLFWFGRPFYEDDDEFDGNGGHNFPLNRRSSTISYANVGAGWGR